MQQISIFEWITGRLSGRRKASVRRKPRRAVNRSQAQSRLSDELLSNLWVELRGEWFPGREDLDSYTVLWSSRPQNRTLASCHVEKRRVVVARELNYPATAKWLPPLLYHEMCHAVLGRKKNYARDCNDWHGPEFKALERKHPLISEFNAWVKSGGWRTAVKSDRAKRAHEHRRCAKTALSGKRE